MIAWLRSLLGADDVERDPRLRMLCGLLLACAYATMVGWYRLPELASGESQALAQIPLWPLAATRHLIFWPSWWMEGYGYNLQMLALLGLFWLLWRSYALLPLGALAFLGCNEAYIYASDFRLGSDATRIVLLMTLLFLTTRPRLVCLRAALALVFWSLALGRLTVGSVSPVAVMELLCPLVFMLSPRPRLSRGAAVALLAPVLLEAPWLGMRSAMVLAPMLILCFLPPPQEHAPEALAPASLALLLFLAIVELVAGCSDTRLSHDGDLFSLRCSAVNRRVRAHIDIEKGERKYSLDVESPWLEPREYPLGLGARVQVLRHTYRKHQLVSHAHLHGVLSDDDGPLFNPRLFREAHTVWALSDPYLYYGYGKQLLEENPPDRLAIRLDVQLEGHEEWHPVLAIDDFKTEVSRYNPLRHNPWVSP